MKFFSKPLVGLDIGSSCIKAIELKHYKKDRYQLVSLGMERLPQETMIDGAILAKQPVADAIKRVFADNKITQKHVCTSISGHSVIVKKITLPAQNTEDLHESIRWEAEQYIPFEISDVNLDYQILGEQKDTSNMDVLLVAVKKEKIADHTNVVTMAGKIPSVVDVDAFALLNAYEVNYQPATSSTVALLDVGASLINITIVRGRDFLFTRDLSIGGSHYTDFLQKEFSLSFDDAESLKQGNAIEGVAESDARNILHSVSEILALEVSKTFDFFKTTSTQQRIDRILLSGGSSQVYGLTEYLSEKFEIPVEQFDSFRSIHYNPKKFDPEYIKSISPQMAIAVGLAVRVLED
jgi:type IV pilus assembly protein PilM